MQTAAYSRALAATALAYAVVHHRGLLPSGLGSAPDDTQVADWLDLLVPWLVLVPAALTLRAAQPVTRTWVVFGVGVVAYVSATASTWPPTRSATRTPVLRRACGTRSSDFTCGTSVWPSWSLLSRTP